MSSTALNGKRKSIIGPDDYDTEANKKPTLSIYDLLYTYFNETTTDEENYINEVSNYFNMLNEPPDTCPNLPDVKKVVNTNKDLSVGQQIYVKGSEDIYIITAIANNNTDITIKPVNTIATRINDNDKQDTDADGATININLIENIININPDSLHIDPNYLAKINTTNANDFDNSTKEGLILKIKYYKTKITICRIKIKRYNIVPRDNSLAKQNEERNLKTYQDKLNETIGRLASISDSGQVNFINDIKKVFRGLYGIGNMSNTLDFFNDNIFKFFFGEIDPETKDVIIKKYIILMDCLSVIGVAGIVNSTNLLLNGRDPRSGWVYFCIKTFIITISRTIPQPIKAGFINYALLPCIGYYLSTNMDTLYLITNSIITNSIITNSSLANFFEYILCGLNNASNIGVNRIEDDDQATIMTNNTNNTNISEVSEKTIETLKSFSTFPSLSIQSLYDSQEIINIDDDNNTIETTYGEELSDLIKTQGKTILNDDDDDSTIETKKTDNSQIPSQVLEGGKIKRSRMTKKHKRMTIRGSKKSKKMKGGKRTRSTKKRRVVRRKKCNNTKRR